MTDVHVVGAGPAGSISAISALRNGHKVTISEDHPVSGLPENCSGLFSIDGLESLHDFIDYKPTIINRIHGANIYIQDELLTVRRSKPVAFVCDRSMVDSILASNAESEGAKIHYGERIRGGEFYSDNIIGADGPFSHVARHFNFPKIRKFVTTLQADISFKCEQRDMVEIFLSNAKFPGFFAWVIPHDDEKAEFGVGVEVPSKALPAWKNLLKIKGHEFGTGSSKVPKPTGAAIPVETRAKTAKTVGSGMHRKNILLVGDAAGQVKSTTGGGVIFGGNCAALAGKYVTKPERYEEEWRAKYGADLTIHKFLHDYLASKPDSSLSRLGKRLNRLNIGEYLSKSGHMDKPTKMVELGLLAHIMKNLV